MFLKLLFDAPSAPAPAPDPGIERRFGHYVRAARGGFSRNTERAMRSDLGIYAEWSSCMHLPIACDRRARGNPARSVREYRYRRTCIVPFDPAVTRIGLQSSM